MYRPYHFDAGDFSILHLSDTQAEIWKVYTCSGSDLHAVLVHFIKQNVKERVVFIIAGDIHAEQTVDQMDFLCGAENCLVRLIKSGEEEFSRSKQDRYGNNAQQTVERGGMVDDDLARDGKQKYFEYGDRRM